MKLYVLCRFALRSQLYTSWLGRISMPYEVVTEYPGTWKIPTDCGMVVTHMHYRWEDLHALRRVMGANSIPVLILADGILEYRNIFEHPSLPTGSVFQPLIGHKLACIGRGQARVIEAWGNLGRCEVVGLPRFDSFLAVPPSPVRETGPVRLTICTANTPAFNESQRAAVIESLNQIKNRFATNRKVAGRLVDLTWRLTDHLEQDLGLPEPANRNELPSLSEVIDQSDAVITTPSTVFLESALKGRPTALLDFHNTPHFVPAAWMINAPKHANAIMNELAAPPKPKMLFQQQVLHDQLECDSPATPRMVQLIETMWRFGEKARAEQKELTFSHRILTDERRGFAVVEQGISMEDLYPDNSVLRNRDLAALQLELNAAIERLESFPIELVHRRQLLEELKAKYDDVIERNQELQDRLTDVKRRLASWREIAKKNAPNDARIHLELEAKEDHWEEEADDKIG